MTAITMLSRKSGVALWRQISSTLESEIREGSHQPGQQLPTELELAKRFGVNRHTVRRAVAALEEQGMVTAEQGRGTFVQDTLVDYTIGKRTRFREIIRAQQKHPAGILLERKRQRADATVAAHLEIGLGAPVIILNTLRTADERPISLGTHYFCAERFDGLADAFAADLSITEALRRFGVEDYVRRTTRVSCRMPDVEEVNHLQVSRSRPLIVTESINEDLRGHAIEYGITRFAGDRVQLVLEP